MNFFWKPCSGWLFMFCWKSKKHTALYCYGDWTSIQIGNNWGGQLDNPIWMGVFWSKFWKHGIRLGYHNSLGRSWNYPKITFKPYIEE